MIALLAALLLQAGSVPAPVSVSALPPGTTASVADSIPAPVSSMAEEAHPDRPDPRFMPDPSGAPTLGTEPLLATPEPISAPPQIIEYSDAYLTRLKIHRYASYATLPLFAAAYVTGNELITKGGNAASWARNTHGAIAGGLGALFVVNTVTGVWNLYEGRHDPEGRTRRIIHSVLMLAADAGFLATAALAPEVEEGEGGGDGGNPTTHRAVAVTSMGLAFASYMTMSWPFRRD